MSSANSPRFIISDAAPRQGAWGNVEEALHIADQQAQHGPVKASGAFADIAVLLSKALSSSSESEIQPTSFAALIQPSARTCPQCGSNNPSENGANPDDPGYECDNPFHDLTGAENVDLLSAVELLRAYVRGEDLEEETAAPDVAPQPGLATCLYAVLIALDSAERRAEKWERQARAAAEAENRAWAESAQTLTKCDRLVEALSSIEAQGTSPKNRKRPEIFDWIVERASDALAAHLK